jgi:hypothetical protein
MVMGRQGVVLHSRKRISKEPAARSWSSANDEQLFGICTSSDRQERPFGELLLSVVKAKIADRPGLASLAKVTEEPYVAF